MKAKAEQLVKQFYLLLDSEGNFRNEAYKQCAVICVNEKIDTLHDICNLNQGMSKQELKHLSGLWELRNEIGNL